MLKIGLLSFGGGYAMLALLENELVSRKKWITKEEFLDMTAIVGSTPGSIAVNASTYIGYKMAGVLGSLIATVAVCIPSFAIIYIISLFFQRFLSFAYVVYAFRGIQICVIFLIMSAGINMFMSLKKDLFTVSVFVATAVIHVFCALMCIRFSSVLYILFGGLFGVVFYLLLKLRERRSNK